MTSHTAYTYVRVQYAYVYTARGCAYDSLSGALEWLTISAPYNRSSTERQRAQPTSSTHTVSPGFFEPLDAGRARCAFAAFRAIAWYVYCTGANTKSIIARHKRASLGTTYGCEVLRDWNPLYLCGKLALDLLLYHRQHRRVLEGGAPRAAVGVGHTGRQARRRALHHNELTTVLHASAAAPTSSVSTVCPEIAFCGDAQGRGQRAGGRRGLELANNLREVTRGKGGSLAAGAPAYQPSSVVNARCLWCTSTAAAIAAAPAK